MEVARASEKATGGNGFAQAVAAGAARDRILEARATRRSTFQGIAQRRSPSGGSVTSGQLLSDGELLRRPAASEPDLDGSDLSRGGKLPSRQSCAFVHPNGTECKTPARTGEIFFIDGAAYCRSHCSFLKRPAAVTTVKTSQKVSVERPIPGWCSLIATARHASRGPSWTTLLNMPAPITARRMQRNSRAKAQPSVVV